ncbi:MAG: type II secretion system F family protein [Candidatus Micrarchaeota archaeon]
MMAKYDPTDIDRLKEEMRRVESEISMLEKKAEVPASKKKTARPARYGKRSGAHNAALTATPGNRRKGKGGKRQVGTNSKLEKIRLGLHALKKAHKRAVAGKLNAALQEETEKVLPQSPIHEPMPEARPALFLRRKRHWREILYLMLGRLASKSQRRKIARTLSYSGLRDDPDAWTGKIIMLSLLSGLLAFMAAWVAFREVYVFTLIVYALLGMIVIFFGAYVHVNSLIEDRRRRLEAVLPDAMQVIAANIRAGMTPVVALRASARPEFGPIADDIKIATTKSLGTDSFTDALQEMALRTNSELFQRVVALFNASLRSGGHLAQLLENTAADIRQSQELRRDLATNTRLYAMFILFTVIVGTPLLLAVSIQFSGMVAGLQERTSYEGVASEISSIPLISSPLSADFLLNSAVVVILITGILASALLGVINNGSYSSGLKYSPFVVGAALVLFVLIKDYGLRAILPVA